MNNNRILCCFKLKTATLFIGICDLFAHIIIILALCGTITNKTSFVNLNITIQQDPNQIDIRKLIQSHFPHGPSRISGLYTRPNDGDFNSQDKSVLLMILICSSISSILLIYGLFKNKACYMMPYFCIKVFHVIIASLTTLGFYSTIPNVKAWLNKIDGLPYKEYLMNINEQTLDLLVFIFLITFILTKLYITLVVWLCYKYLTSKELYTRGSLSNQSSSIASHTIKLDSDEFLLAVSPPKYEDIVKNSKETNDTSSITSLPPPYKL